MRGALILYVTGHGFGHATRASALAAALKRLRPDLDLEVRSDAPAWLFTESCPGLPVSRGGADPGLRQRDALDIDLEASLALQQGLDADWPRLVEEEAAWLSARGAALVAADIPPLAFAAAAAAGVPSIGISNFSWDWILEPYAAADSRWAPARRRCAGAYARAEEALRLPLSGAFPAFQRVVDAPLLCRKADPAAAERWRAREGLDFDRRTLVLLAFGGFGLGPLELKAGENLAAYAFAGFGPKPEGLNADWHELRSGTNEDQLAAAAACDLILSKPGYGVFSEALAFGKPVLYVPREGFREIGALVAGLKRRGACAPLPREDFEAGRWRAGLERLLVGSAPAPVPADGDEWIARRLLARLDAGGHEAVKSGSEGIARIPAMKASDRLRRRASGVLLHVTSLPGGHGCGDLGPQARRFADFLAEAKQAWWQMLPVGPIGAANSPYSSPSAFAGCPWLISLEDLVEDGLLESADLAVEAPFPKDHADYDAMRAFKEPRLRKAFAAFTKGGSGELWDGFKAFVRQHQEWVEDYANFCALKDYFHGKPWTQWDPVVRDRKFRQWPRELLKDLGEESAYHQFVQFLFARQWARLRRHAEARGVDLIGDVPIFVAHESADVWAHREIFQLDEQGRPLVVAGVPPDYFSEDGQLWGNPHYRWDVLKRRGYDWWLARLSAAAERFEAVRLDHFIGFYNYWEIPADAKTAKAGRWVAGPGEDFFEAVRLALPQLELIAEDLGCVTARVTALRDRFDLPGMRVLQFAFGSDDQAESFLPHNYPRRTVAYSGTHDNDTTRGWYEDPGTAPGARMPQQIEKEKHNARVYLHSDGARIHWDMIRCLLRSTADVVVFPAQDLLGLGTEARMNKPGTVEKNWEWRLPRELDKRLADKLSRLTEESGRSGGTRGK